MLFKEKMQEATISMKINLRSFASHLYFLVVKTAKEKSDQKQLTSWWKMPCITVKYEHFANKRDDTQ